MNQNQQQRQDTGRDTPGDRNNIALPAESRQGVQWLVFCGLISAGVGARLLCRDLPNFAPVAALALFAGYFFSSRLLAIMVPVLVMVISDFTLGTYNPGLMIVVYSMLALPVMMRTVLRRHLNFSPRQPRAMAFSSLGIVGCSLLASFAFFLVTNLAVWWQATWYTANLAGLAQCYTQALPFFRYTMGGDLLFTILLFGGHALVMARSLELPGVSVEQS